MRKLLPDAKLVAVEPVAANIKMSKRYGAIDMLDYFEQVALWSTCRKIPMCQDNERSLVPQVHGLDMPQAIEVDAITVDELRRKTEPWPEPILCWFDCEGSEYEVMKGMSFTPRWINMEVIWRQCTPGCMNAYQIESYMLSRGYAVYGMHSVAVSGSGGDAVFATVAECNAIREEHKKARQARVAFRHAKQQRFKK